MACKLFWEEKGVLFLHEGIVTEHEVQEMNNRIYGDKRFESISYQISDYTAATDIRLSSRDAKVIGTLDRMSARWNFKKMRIAVVTADVTFIHVVEDYFQEFEGTAWEGKIFPTLELAYGWVRS